MITSVEDLRKNFTLIQKIKINNGGSEAANAAAAAAEASVAMTKMAATEVAAN